MIQLLAAVVAMAAPQPWPYPSKPAGVRLFSDKGLLTAYNLGNHNGGMTIRHDDGTSVHFYIAYPNKVDGHHYYCQQFPRVGDLTGGDCDQRPKNVVIGKTRVHVSWWWGKMYDRRERISNEIWTSGS